MAIGRNFTEALGKALRSLEDAKAPFRFGAEVSQSVEELLTLASAPHDGRITLVMDALMQGASTEAVFDATKIDPWFLHQLELLRDLAAEVRDAAELTSNMLHRAKRHGFSDEQVAVLRNLTPEVVRALR